VLFDSHNHLQSPRFGRPVAELVAAMRAAGITGCVVNATRESDWEAVRGLREDYPDFVRPAYGVHPWFAHTVKEGWQDRLRDILSEDPLATVGEIGLDGWVESPTMEIQQPVFQDQVKIAVGLGRTMTIHCLKAWEPLFDAIDRAPAWPGKFLMHSFGGSIEVARRLIPHGAWFSFSGYFLSERKAGVLEVFKQLPKERILLETDAPEMLPPQELIRHVLDNGMNHPANLESVAREFQNKLGVGIMEQIERNTRDFWQLSH
jgi:TatD DNase family protein